MSANLGEENLVSEELHNQESVDIQQSKSVLETRLSMDQQNSRTPKELTFKDLVKNFDFQETHSSKLLRKQSRCSSLSLDSEHCPPSHTHLIRHESLGLRKRKSVPANNGTAFVGVLQQWVERYKSGTETRQRENQRYGRKMPLPRVPVEEVIEQPELVDFGRCLSITEGQKFWDDLAASHTDAATSYTTSPRSVTAPLRSYSFQITKSSRTEISRATTSSTSLTTLDRIKEFGRDDLSVTGGITVSEDGPLSRRMT